MIKNYIKVAFRNLKKNKSFVGINVLGLSIGLATCLLIVFYIGDELRYDRFNINADRIFRVNVESKFGSSVFSNAASQVPMAGAMKADLPEIEETVRFRRKGGFNVKKGNENIQENKVIYADPGLFNMFTLPMIEGDPSTALKEPRSVVVTATIAKKYFNKTEIVGETMVFNDSINFKVTGVIKDIPDQSHFKFDFFLSMPSLAESKSPLWGYGGYNTYVMLRKGANYRRFEAQLPAFLDKYKEERGADKMKNGDYVRLSLSPLTSIHLHSNRLYELGNNGNIQYVYIFAISAILILVLACVNFMNLSTASFSNRAREVGVRKVLGSPRRYLIAQFLTESFLITFISTVIALLLTWTFMPMFNQLSGKDLSIGAQLWVWVLPCMVGLTIVIGFLAGSYPAIFLSGFRPVNVLKGRLSAGFKGGAFRSFLVTFQFSISIFLIIGTLVIYSQLNYIQTKDVGYDRNQVLVIKNVTVLGSQAKTLKQELKQLHGVESVTMTDFLPTSGNTNYTALFPGLPLDSKKLMLTQFWPVDNDYISTMAIKMVAGRNFSGQMATDSSAVVINEVAAKSLGFSDPVGKDIYRSSGSLEKYRIIGVMKDFNFNSLKENITPVVLVLEENRGAIGVRVRTDNLPALLSQVENKWTALSPNQHFEYSFMDEDFDATYRAEQRVGTIFLAFTILAIAIACLGLFGLATYAAEQRAKEIGIRKVLGANVSTIVGLLSKDFIKLVLIAILIASPVAWFLMHKWLEDFAYRVSMSGWTLVIAGLLALMIAFITISLKSVRAALSNPAKTLKTE